MLGERTISFEFDENGSSATDTEGTGNNPSNGGDNPSNGGGDNPSTFPSAGDTYQGCYVLASTVATDGESAELTLLSPNEKESSGNTGMTLSVLETVAAGQGTDGISGWRPMTHSEALLLQAAHTALGIDDIRKYLFDDDGTVKQMQMSNASVSNPSTNAAYIRPVATVTISKE